MALTTFNTGDVVVSRIQNRRGNRVNLPQPLAPGEFGWCLDTKQLFIGLSEEDSIAGLEVYTGGTVNAQPIVQAVISQRLIELNTKFMRVSNIVPSIQLPGSFVSEEALLLELEAIPSSSYVDSVLRAQVVNIENNVTILNLLTQAVKTSLGGPAGFEDQALITYDWVKQAQTSAQVTVAATAGAVTSVSAINAAGLGYLPNPSAGTTITLADLNGDATFTANISTDGQGTLLSMVVTNAGTGYTTGDTIILTAPTIETLQATATATETLGIIDSTTMTLGGGSYSGVPKVTIVGNTGSGAEISAVVTAGEITSLNIDVAGTGYTSPVILEIEAPVSTALYKFTYDVGVADKNGTLFVDPIAPDYTNLLGAIASLDAVVEVDNVGVLGTAPGVGAFSPRNKEMVGGLLLLDRTRQSSNVASIINTLSSSSNGLVTTKQNIEIVTELSAQTSAIDVLLDNLITYELIPNPAFPGYNKITNDVLAVPPGTGTYAFLDLEYDVTESDVQSIDYSVKLDSPTLGYTSTGTITVVANPLVSGSDQATLSETSTEVRDSGIPPLTSAGPDIEFRAVYNVVRQVVELEYKHNFPANVILKVSSKRWLSF